MSQAAGAAAAGPGRGGSRDDGAARPGGPASAKVVWCDHCGGALGDGAHDRCAAARALEPPRFCPDCRRRMKVQVLPAGWSATCVEHGTRTA